MNRPPHLFDPSDVVRLLRGLPHLAKALGDPVHDWKFSTSFPLARTSERQLFRVLGNDHYDHLSALLRSLDFCLGRGFTQPALLRTRARSHFASGLSELAAAEHFILRGFDVDGLDARKASEPVPEFLAGRGGLNVAVEVYHPVEWEGLSALTDELTEVLKNLDVPLDYRFEIKVEQLEHLDERSALRYVHPGALARDLDAGRRAAITGPMLEEIATRLAGGAKNVEVQTEERDLNIRVLIAITGAIPSAFTLPARVGVISPLGLTGYAPEAMFDRLVSERVRRKAAKAQGRMAGRLAVLIVDLAESEVTTQMGIPAYRRDFVSSLGRSFGTGLRGYDVIAFCEHDGWGRELVTHFVLNSEHVPEEALGVMFGPTSRPLDDGGRKAEAG